MFSLLLVVIYLLKEQNKEINTPVLVKMSVTISVQSYALI